MTLEDKIIEARKALEVLEEQLEAEKENKMIKMDKKYKTRDGQDGRILCINAELGSYGSVIGIVDKTIKTWRIKGEYYSVEPSIYDLIEVWEPQDKELIWCYNHAHTRLLKFWDGKNKCTFSYSGRRDGSNWRNYAKADNLPPEILEWADEARKTLED